MKRLSAMKGRCGLLGATLLAFGCLAALGALGPVMAAGGARENAPDIDFSFEGVFGVFDRGQLQRGYLVYRDVCAGCHSARFLTYRNLGEPGGPEFSPEEVKAIAAEFEVEDGPDEEGEMFMRPALPSDGFVSPFPNEQAARASNNGAFPPDLSLITRAREGWSYPWYSSPFIKFVRGGGGAEYVYALLTGYAEEPHGEERDGQYYNPYFSGRWIAMAPPLFEDGVEYGDGTPATVAQQAEDVAAFLEWAAEPKMEERKKRGFMVLIYMALFGGLVYFTKKRIWAKQKKR